MIWPCSTTCLTIGKETKSAKWTLLSIAIPTGIGMAVAANKVHGIRAVNCINVQFAQLAREHNDANIVTLSGRFVDAEENERKLDAFLSTEFGGGRHAGRVEKIMALEN